MLSQKNIDTIKATIPVLEENGVALTKHFYDRMFRHNPEVKKFFNTSRQKNSSQPEALAAAILAYAKNIENLEVLGNAVELIAQKHASLQIKADHYPIVGSNLIESIKEVLDLNDNDDIVIAWTEAYNLLAEILINREKSIYEENLEHYGWNNFKEFEVIKKENESINTYSFYFKNDLFRRYDFKPGQYLTVRVPYNGTTTMRNYSISSATGEDYIRITVKREGQGYVSQYLSHEIKVGDKIEIAPPCGEFFLEVNKNLDKPIVLISAGIGITPLMSMLLSELKTQNQRQILFVCGKKNKNEHPFAKLLEKLSNENPRLKTIFFYEDNSESDAKQGLVCIETVQQQLSKDKNDAQYFFCGPKEFMLSVHEKLLKNGIREKNIHYEFFGSKTV
ncbi:NO-inducible flavohemoprotein [Francisella philomiragia]|uniref:NO-inducible flavohemoprotein n=1 Tax=Francisella philomiragia TaxID=28110 RepID=UPI001906E81E|nr:NO-inducible flavohemoprotein [Francisella philomiragia]MBK2266528.1 NO-inducible flavohemoprotein [Francisella philomiragia]MBK2278304.1 NO-inducible flavohemoprotein [Francisella philomiragia]MBK2286160.1 NO-inducible flavohemoprotein [Francisella philomiragia]MBK2287811.1 NO-inducible flavohemoprotein [Francisella philomiragia]MBK2290119.1 NO-inducible flavohemoprotein [Francisella philomiragia]